MINISKPSIAVIALLAVVGPSFAVGSAQAADLGGDCCADLEERIAELEATTARKGNRKVKLEVSGHVNEAILLWDDGVESNAGVYTNDNARTRFRFKGDAKISDDLKAGYLLEIGVRGANSKRFNQENVDGCAAPQAPGNPVTGIGPTPAVNNCGLDVRHSVWFVDSKSFGKVWVGLTGGAGEGVTEINLAATKDVMKYSDVEDTGGGLYTRSDGERLANFSSTSGQTGLEWRQLLRGGGDQPGEGRRYNMVRYDTPEIAGFIGTANWGEDDTWEIGLRQKGEHFGFKFAWGIAYGENSEGPVSVTQGDSVPGFQCLGNNRDGVSSPSSDPDTRCKQFGGSISVMHEDTGLYGNFAGGYLEDEAINTDPGFKGFSNPDDTSYFYAFEAGIERKWMSLGKTTIFGQYYINHGGSQDRTVGEVSSSCDWTNTSNYSSSTCNAFSLGDILSSEVESYGAGIVQGIDAAAMHLYLTYRRFEGEVKGNGPSGGATPGPTLQLDSLDVVMGGGIIRF